MTKKANEFPVYPSMSAAAGALNVNVDVLRRLKKQGCPAFDAGNRVNTERLLRWLLRRGASDKPALDLNAARAKLAMAQAMKLETEARLAGGKLLPVGWLHERISEAFEAPALSSWLFERIPLLAFHIQTAIKQLPDAEQLPEADRLLRGDAQEIRLCIRDAKTKLMKDLAKGCDETGPRGTIYQDTVDLLKRTAERLTPEQRDAVFKIMGEISSEIESRRASE